MLMKCLYKKKNLDFKRKCPKIKINIFLKEPLPPQLTNTFIRENRETPLGGLMSTSPWWESIHGQELLMISKSYRWPLVVGQEKKKENNESSQSNVSKQLINTSSHGSLEKDPQTSGRKATLVNTKNATSWEAKDPIKLCSVSRSTETVRK